MNKTKYVDIYYSTACIQIIVNSHMFLAMNLTRLVPITYTYRQCDTPTNTCIYLCFLCQNT